MPHNIPCASDLFKLTRVTSCTFVVCVYLKQFMQCDRAIASILVLLRYLKPTPKPRFLQKPSVAKT